VSPSGAFGAQALAANMTSSSPLKAEPSPALSAGAVWRRFRNQPASFWFASIYLFFEYVRPQSIYTSIDFAPWSMLSLLAALACCVFEGRLAFTESGLWGVLLAFFLVVVASSFTAQYPEWSTKNHHVWLNWLLATVVFVCATGTRERLMLLFLGFVLWNFKMSQHATRTWVMDGFAWRDWGASGSPGWFENSGEFGIEMCVFFPFCAYFLVALWPHLRRWQRLALASATVSAVIGMVASSSRGAMLGGAAVAVWMLLRSPHRVRAAAFLMPLAALAYFLLPEENLARWSTAGEDETSVARLTYWRHGLQIAAEFPLLGIGYKNWMPYYRDHFNPEGQLPHNILVECVAELGVAGLLSFVALVVATFVANHRVRRRTNPRGAAPDRFAYYMAYGLDGALIGYLVSAQFVTVLFYPYFWVNFAFTIALFRASHARSDLRRLRGAIGVPVKQGHFSRGRLAPTPMRLHRGPRA
jgi:O-antigen ligase